MDEQGRTEPPEMALLRGPLSQRATSAEFNEWQAREIVSYVDRLIAALASPSPQGREEIIAECAKALEPLLELQTSESAPAELTDDEADIWVRGHNSAMDEAVAALRALSHHTTGGGRE